MPDGEGGASPPAPDGIVERTVPRGETDRADDVWRLKERIRRRDGALAQKRGFFAVQYRRSRVYLQLVDDVVVGFAVARPDGYVSLLGIDPDRRRCGLASRLVDRAAADHERLTCHVRASNDPALAFYADRGFAIERRSPGYYRDGTDAYLLVRDPERANRLGELLQAAEEP